VSWFILSLIAPGPYLVGAVLWLGYIDYVQWKTIAATIDAAYGTSHSFRYWTCLPIDGDVESLTCAMPPSSEKQPNRARFHGCPWVPGSPLRGAPE
jgi:hypothetical protein